MKVKSIVLFVILFLLPTSCYPIRYDGPYKGKIVDASTRKPIEGVVVLGVWYKQIATAAGGVSSYYDARETITDKNGEFEISGIGLKILSNVEPMNFLIFKAGYEYHGGPWESLTVSEYYRRRITWEGKKAVIPLRKLTIEERNESSTFPPSPPGEVPKEKIKLIMEEIHKERKERGLN